MAKNAVRGAENCRLEQAERNRYFFGKLLTARDFELEQGYHLEKVRSIHRYIHGVGIVCGLQVEEPQLEDGKLSVLLHPGVGYDCCGRQIVVSREGIVTVQEEALLEGEGYLYLRYVEVEKEPVPSLPNSGTSEPDCRPSRTQERFEVIFSDESPPAPDAAFVFNSEGEDLEARNIELAGKYYRERLEQCPECSEPKVFLAVVRIPEAGGVLIDQEKTDRYRRLVFSNRMLRDLLAGHLQNFANPHNTTAEQVGALVSINGVENPGGNVELVAKDAVTLKADRREKTITVGESHSRRRDNPHQVTASQVKALTGINGVENPGGSVQLRSSDRSIRIEPQPERNAVDLTTAIPAGGEGRIFYGHAPVRIDGEGFVRPEVITVEDLREGEPFAVLLAPVLDGQDVPPVLAPALTPGWGDNAVYGGLARENIKRRERTFVAFIPKSREGSEGDWVYHRKFEIHGLARDFRNRSVLVAFWIIAGARPARIEGGGGGSVELDEAIKRYLRESEKGGTLPEMSSALGVSTEVLDARLKELIALKVVEVRRGRYRLTETAEGTAPQPEPEPEPEPEPKPKPKPDKPPEPPAPPADEDPIIAYLRQSEKGGTLPSMSNGLGIPIADLNDRLKKLIEEGKVEVKRGRYQLVAE